MTTVPVSARDNIVNQLSERLTRRFPRLSISQVREVVVEEYDLLADNPIRLYVPNLIEHEARERLRKTA